MEEDAPMSTFLNNGNFSTLNNEETSMSTENLHNRPINQVPPTDLQATFDGILNENVIDELLNELGNIPENDMERMFIRQDGVGSGMMNVDSTDSQWIGQWNRFCELASNPPNDAVRSQLERYGREFTTILEFRSQFADAIERKCWDFIDIMNLHPGSENMQRARAIVYNLQAEIHQALSGPNNLPFELVSRLQQWERELQGYQQGCHRSGHKNKDNQEMAAQVKDRYSHQPMDLVQLVVRMFSRERSIMEFASNQPAPSPAASTTGMVPSPGGVVQGANSSAGAQGRSGSVQTQREKVQSIMTELSELEQQIRQVTIRLDRMTADYQDLQFCTSGNVVILATPQALQNQANRTTVESLVKRYTSLVQEKKHIIFTCHRDNFSRKLTDLVTKLEGSIALWKRTEAYVSNGRRIPNAADIDQLEDCCKPITQLLNTSLEHIVKLRFMELTPNDPNQEHQLIALQQIYERNTQELVKKTLLVEKQPPQVLMKDKKFVCQLRHLMGQQLRFDTKVWLVNAEEAHSILEGTKKGDIHPAGTIVNNVAKADYIEQTRQLYVHMRNMSLRMRQRGDRGRADCVAEEKFCMVFRSEITLRFPANTECTVTAETMSLPIVVISHGKQEADAQATIFWDNAFSSFNRHAFDVPDTVRWDVLLDELHWFWIKNCKDTGSGQREARGLDEDAKRYLTVKLLGKDERNVSVQWRQFNRDNLPAQNFTFWTWLFKIIELVSSPYVKKYWNAGLMKGFISKADCQRLLLPCQLGTFLFRFSDSTLGAVSISCYTLSKFTGHHEVGHLEPDTIQKLKARSLPDMVKDIRYLLYLYPNHRKDDVFGEFYSPDPATEADPGAYWKKGLETVTSNDNDFDRPDSVSSPMPATPSSMSRYPLSPVNSPFSPTPTDISSPPRY